MVKCSVQNQESLPKLVGKFFFCLYAINEYLLTKKEKNARYKYLKSFGSGI